MKRRAAGSSQENPEAGGSDDPRGAYGVVEVPVVLPRGELGQLPHLLCPRLFAMSTSMALRVALQHGAIKTDLPQLNCTILIHLAIGTRHAALCASITSKDANIGDAQAR